LLKGVKDFVVETEAISFDPNGEIKGASMLTDIKRNKIKTASLKHLFLSYSVFIFFKKKELMYLFI
jgi:hypothetical protein